MRLREKLLKVVAALCVLSIILSAVTPVFAANTKDEKFYFWFRAPNQTAGSNGRNKTDSSSVYINIKYIDIQPVNIYVDGSNSSNGGWVNCTINSVAYADRLGQFRIRNNVYERRYSYARITGWSPKSAGTVSGYWSPDCSTTAYRALN